VLADLARRGLRAKLPELAEALEGRFSAHHAVLVAHILAKIDQADEMIAALSAQVLQASQPHKRYIELLSTIPGVKQRVAEAIVAEIGIDMIRFGSSQRLASSAGMCPGNNQSGGKRRAARKRKGSPWLALHLSEAAQAAGRTDTYLGAQYRRLRTRRGPSNATKALGHSNPRCRLPHAAQRHPLCRPRR
jgi:transposase